MINNKCFFFDLFMNKFNSSRFSNIDHISKHDWKSFSMQKHISVILKPSQVQQEVIKRSRCDQHSNSAPIVASLRTH